MRRFTRASWKRLLILVSPVVIFGLACSTSEPTATPTDTTQDADQVVAQSASYRIELPIGPVVTMMEFTEMSTMDQGQPVNYHLKVHIFDASSGAVVMDVIPVVRITNQATGVSREMETGTFSRVHANVMACMVSKSCEQSSLRRQPLPSRWHIHHQRRYR